MTKTISTCICLFVIFSAMVIVGFGGHTFKTIVDSNISHRILVSSLYGIFLLITLFPAVGILYVICLNLYQIEDNEYIRHFVVSKYL
jgi:uncharacterized membrane protein